jgi:REP-associated tyrosine transposase
MPTGLERRYGHRHLHFITCSCRKRLPLLNTPRRRNEFLKILGETQDRYQFAVTGYVVMPEHVHLLISEPKIGTPSTVMQVVKQRVANQFPRRSARGGQFAQGDLDGFWEERFYDFNVWSRKKIVEKLQYMHMNPVKRDLVAEPKLWIWSSFRFYQYGEKTAGAPNISLE